jgi:hypothetical protein
VNLGWMAGDPARQNDARHRCSRKGASSVEVEFMCRAARLS